MSIPKNHQVETNTTYTHTIWLDAKIWDENNDSKQAQKKFREHFGRCNFVTNTTDCEKVINKSVDGTTFVLIVSGQIGSRFVPEIHENPKYSSIYVYCGNTTEHEKWAIKYEKVSCFLLLSVFIIVSFI
jgi:hypothetical protein